MAAPTSSATEPEATPFRTGSTFFLGALALLSSACGAAPHPAAATTAPITTVELPAAAAPAAPPSPVASAAPAEPADPPGPGPLAQRSSNITLDTPPFVARFAVVFRSGSLGASSNVFGDDSVVLFETQVTCADAEVKETAPRHLSTGVTWKAGEKVTFQQLVFKNGKGMQHKGAIEILRAPSNKGDVGRIRLTPFEGANVTGGDIDALVCD